MYIQNNNVRSWPFEVQLGYRKASTIKTPFIYWNIYKKESQESRETRNKCFEEEIRSGENYLLLIADP